MSPAISNDGKVVAYSLIKPEKKNKNVQLYIVDVETKKSTLVSNLKGINSGAVFLPGDKELVLTLTHSGNAEIYKLNLITKKIIPLTNHWAADVDPSVSPDGKVAFLSSRPGKPMIYLMDLNGVEKGVKGSPLLVNLMRLHDSLLMEEILFFHLGWIKGLIFSEFQLMETT